MPIAGNFHGFHAWQESRNPRHDNAISQGIETIYQESALVAQLTISGSGASHSTALSRRAHRCARDDGVGLAFAHETNFVIEGTGETVQAGKQ